MKSRIRTIITHPLTSAYVALLIVLEVLVFVLFPLETASGLYLSVAALWALVPFLAYFTVRLVQGKVTKKAGAAFVVTCFVGVLGGFAAYGFVLAFNHKITTQVVVFQARSTYYSGRGSSNELLVTDYGTRYEVNDPTGGGWDGDHFWHHVTFGRSYRCKLFSSPALRYSEIYDCGKLARQSPPASSSVSTSAAGTTAPAAPSSSPGVGTTATVSAGDLKTVSFKTIYGSHAQLNLALPSGATVSTQSEIVTVTIAPATVFTVEAGPEDASSYFAGVTTTTLTGGVLEGKSEGLETYAKNVTGGSIEVIGVGLSDSPVSIPGILAQSTGTISQ